MLNIALIAYQDKSLVDQLKTCSPNERYQRIMGTYVEQMLQRHPAENSARNTRLKARLSYLACKMLQQRQVVFFLEYMQPSWIDKDSWLRIYLWLAALLPGALIGALTGILANVLLFHAGSIGSLAMDAVYGIVIGYLFSSLSTASSFSAKPVSSLNKLDTPHAGGSSSGTSLKTALFISLISFLLISSAKGWEAGLANSLFLGITSIPIQKLLHKKRWGTNTQTAPCEKYPLSKFFPFEHFKRGLLIGLACGFTSIITLLVNQAIPKNGLIFLFTLMIRDSLRNTLLGILLSVLLVKVNGVISCAEVVVWSWKKLGKSLKSRNIVYDLLIGIVIGVIFGSKQLLQGNFNDIISAGLSTGLLITLGIRLVTAILEGISSNSLNDHYRMIPNEGIKRSFYHGLICFIMGAALTTFFTLITSILSFAFSYGLPSLIDKHGLQTGISTGLLNSLLLAPTGGLLAALLLGWLAPFQHWILRLILRITDKFPLKLSSFLDYATNCVLLRRAGGGYIFIHRTLLEYFAGLEQHHESQQGPKPSQPEPLVRLL